MLINIDVEVGDLVFNIYGDKGHVHEICHCERCRDRGWFEPVVQYDEGGEEWITNYAMENGFQDFYIIGSHVFHDHLKLDELKEHLEQVISEQEVLHKREEGFRELIELYKQNTKRNKFEGEMK